MEDMDIDFDFETDPVKDFLLHKLEEMKLKNTILQENIAERKDLLKQAQESVIKSNGPLTIESSWTHVYNDKYCVGFNITTNDTRNIRIENVILNWNSSFPMMYIQKIFTKYTGHSQTDAKYLKNEWIVTETIQDHGCIVLVMNKPNFLKQLAYNLTGVIIYKSQQNQFQIQLPKLTISVETFTNPLHEIKNINLLAGDDKAFFIFLAANRCFELIGKLPKCSERKIQTLLAIQCMLRELQVVSKKKYFLVDAISSSIDGCVLEVFDPNEDGVFTINILAGNSQQLLQLLYYLYQHIEEVIIFPKSHNAHLVKTIPQFSQSLPSDDNQAEKLKTFCTYLLDEISLIKKFVDNNVRNKECALEKYLTFRKDLNTLEYKTDILYATTDFSNKLDNI